ncbi:hypothetical protein VE01_06608 [Pseudogymnoascus verrucosus]|uniref:GPI anchored protein n=1 Tax=Pseudogymnoascus verrucosus TaxID=342668 RepID=A0A1B8GHK2_9PEZI|nr:uncharacterized protein VE01_06608 [Pseudogymnoascus verrucosus]OBT95294.1 hypothetical protein VE01_06608 [Pseudogymnoascus verrucosus]
MARLRILGAVAFLLLQVARCDDSPVSRDYPLVPGEIEGTPPIKYSPPAGSMPLNGRELVSEWSNTGFLSKRYCVDAGYVPCSDTGCCPSLGQCCPGSPYCKAQSNGVCCGSTGVCPGGFECNSICRCVETGGSCCADGRYCQAGHSCCYSGCVPDGGQCCSNGQMCDVGNICVVNLSNGRYGCCTDLSCTAYVESGSTIALTHSTPVVTTEAPRVTQTVDSGYVYYYWTFTWSYYSYYYTYIYQVTTLTTTYVTTTTIISAYESDSAAATSELNRISSKYFSTGFPTPTDATTALAATTNANTPSETGSSGNDGNNGGSLPGVGIGGVGGGGGSVGGAGMVKSSLPTLTLWAFAMGAVAVGTGMLLL